MKKFVLLAVAAMAMTVTASAATVLAACASTQQYGSLRGNPAGCTQADKIYGNFANLTGGIYTGVIPDTWDVNITEAITDNHRIQFTQGSSPTSVVAGTYGVTYTIDVNTGIAPFNYITSVGVTVDIGGGGTATKVIKDRTVGANFGNILATIVSSGGQVNATMHSQHLLIEETIWVPKGQSLQSFTDVYRQTYIPEPATYGMMGLGLAALGLISRRKKA